MITKVINQGLT